MSAAIAVAPCVIYLERRMTRPSRHSVRKRTSRIMPSAQSANSASPSSSHNPCTTRRSQIGRSGASPEALAARFASTSKASSSRATTLLEATGGRAYPEVVDERGHRLEGRDGSREKASPVEIASYALVAVAAGAVWPRVVFYRGWLRGRGLIISMAADMLFRFALLHWMRPWAARHQARFDHAREELLAATGREPTEREVMQELGYEVR